MKFKKTVTRLLSILIVSVFCFTLFFVSGFAVDINKNGSITLHVADSEEKIPLQGATFRLYLFAAAHKKSDGVGYEYVIPYDNCNMDMDNLQDPYLPVHLAYFALTHSLPCTEITSDAKGNIVFDKLLPGVYLILATDILENYFLPSPFVVNIPIYNHEEESWEYDINATPKMQIRYEDVQGEYTYLSVKKQWDSDEEIPEKITVSLLCDLQEMERIELSEENNWYYRWDKLDKQYTWNVVENAVPDGYKVSYDFSSNAIIITNTKDVEDETTTMPDETTTDEASSSPDESTTVPDESTTKPDELIDTGQLNWPVPVFSTAGLVLFSIGWIMLKFGKKDEETV